MLRLTVTATGEEFFELNKAEPGAVLFTTKKITRAALMAVKITEMGKYSHAPVPKDARLRRLKRTFPI